jgi:hypothetical protein
MAYPQLTDATRPPRGIVRSARSMGTLTSAEALRPKGGISVSAENPPPRVVEMPHGDDMGGALGLPSGHLPSVLPPPNATSGPG